MRVPERRAQRRQRARDEEQEPARRCHFVYRNAEWVAVAGPGGPVVHKNHEFEIEYQAWAAYAWILLG